MTWQTCLKINEITSHHPSHEAEAPQLMPRDQRDRTVFEAMLEGWRRQSARFLKASTMSRGRVDSLDNTVHLFV